MALDANTVFFLVMATCFLVGAMLLLAWDRNRKEMAYVWWAAGFVTAGLGLGLISLGRALAGATEVALGSLLILAGLTLCWGGARTFDKRPITAWPVAIGLLSWAVINLVPEISASGAARGAVMSILLAFYSIAIGAEFWRGRGDALASRIPLAALCFINAGIHLARVALAWLPEAPAPEVGDVYSATLLFQPALILVAGGLYAVGLGRDRVEQELRRTAEIDSLTGVLNRGSLFDRGDELMKEAARGNVPLAILLFDLDRFKEINDSLGHLAGDAVLRHFANVAKSGLRGTDVIGRIGGEEFCIILPGASASRALLAAERVRQEFAESRIEHDGVAIPATVSVGVAALEGRNGGFDHLLSLADRALYGAKRSGRDRVVTSALSSFSGGGFAPGREIDASVPMSDRWKAATAGDTPWKLEARTARPYRA